MATTPPSAPYLYGLNTVRFLAALNVVMVHASGYPDAVVGPLFNATDAVTIFFVLSGYLIAYRLLIEREQTGDINLTAFYVRRALRILPLYYVVALVGCFVLPQIGAPAPSRDAIISIFLLLPQIMYGLGMPSGTVIQLWSIGVEELFYLFFPALIRRWSLVRVCLIIIAVSTIWGGLLYSLDSPYLFFFRLMRFECMAIGALAAYAVVHRPDWLALIQHRTLEIRAPGALLLIAIFKSSLPLYDLIVSLLVAVFLVNISTHPDPVLRLEWAWSKAAGELSYGIYIWHLPILWFWSIQLTGWPFLLAGIGTTLAVAWLSYHGIERPILRLKDRYQPVQKIVRLS